MKQITCWKLETQLPTNLCKASNTNGEKDSFVAYFATKVEAEKAKPYAVGPGVSITLTTIQVFDTANEWNPQQCD